MSVYLLLDTCILKRLISTTEFSQHLAQLKYIVENRYVDLLVPDVLVSEWEKHREAEKRKLDAELRSEKIDVKLRSLFEHASAEAIQEKIDDAYALLHTQVETVDDLLLNKSIRIATTADLLVMVHEQRTANKKPFGEKGKDSTNDTLLIFSALDYLERNKANGLYFISDNHSDFAAGSVESYFLHPHITSRFPSVTMHYFTKIEQGYAAFDALSVPRHKKGTSGKRLRLEKEISIDRTNSILDQVHEYLERRFRELAFIPKKFFAEHYPFVVSDSFPFSHRLNTLVTDNQAVFDLLTKVKIEYDEVNSEDPEIIKSDSDKEKARRIFRVLWSNTIHQVAFGDMEPVPLVFKASLPACNCPLCQYKRMDWHDIIDGQPFLDNSEEDASALSKLRVAYGHYKVGDYYTSARLLQRLCQETANEKGLIRYIVGFNLKHLAPILRSHNWDYPQTAALAEELTAIDLDKLFEDCSGTENHELLEWLHRKLFISEGIAVMHEKVREITDRFYGRSAGFNEYTFEMTDEYNAIDLFLSRNGIMYDYFSRFQDLTDLQTQGLLASYGCKPGMGGRLSNLNDYWLTKLLFWGKAEVIQKFIVRFRLKDIEYKGGSETEISFADRIAAIGHTYDEIEKTYSYHEHTLSRYFWDKHGEVVHNAVTLLGVVALERSTFNQAANNLLDLLQRQKKHTHFLLLRHLRFLFQRKQKEFSNEVLVRFYLTAIENKAFQADLFFEIVCAILEDRKIKVELTDGQFAAVEHNFLNALSGEYASSAWYATAYIFRTLKNEQQKETIAGRVRACLDKSFKSEQYNLAVMLDIIAPDERFNNGYAEAIENIMSLGRQNRLFPTREYYADSRVDNYLNFCWKFLIPIRKGILENASKLSHYYEWLIDLDNFDYRKFNTDWLYKHFTVYFKRQFRSSMVLKDHLLQLIKENPNAELERIFMMIYCYDD